MNDPMLFQRPGPMPFRLLIDEALRQARRHFRALYLPVAIPVAALSTLIPVAQALWFPSLMSGDPSSLGMLPGFYLLLFVYIGIVMVAYMALQVGVIDALNGRPVDMKRAWGFAIQGRALGTLILWYVATIASFVCCCVPGLYVAPLLSLVSSVMVDEGRFGVDALRRSAELTQHPMGPGFFDRPLFRILLFLIIGVVISYLLGLLVALPFQIPMWIEMFRQGTSGADPLQNVSGFLWLQVPAQFLNALVSTAVSIYISFGIALFFFDARGRKEGVDLRSEIDEVFGGPPPPELPLV
jgi:hypothetical protein